MDNYKHKNITWEEFEVRLRKQITSNPKAMDELKRIKDLSDKQDVYLIYYEKEYSCHRFILMDIIKKIND